MTQVRDGESPECDPISLLCKREMVDLWKVIFCHSNTNLVDLQNVILCLYDKCEPWWISTALTPARDSGSPKGDPLPLTKIKDG